MTLEGSLEAFSLPDIFQLLSFTKKTGALRITGPAAKGVVHFATGSVTGATSDVSRQSLARRLVGANLLDDAALAAAVAKVDEDPSVGIGKAAADAGLVDEGVLHEQVVEQATDAVFDLLRWSRGDFAFVEEPNPDDLGVSLNVEEVIAEGRRRMEEWETLTKAVPSPDSVVCVVLKPSADETSLTAEEWAMLALADGRRTVSDLVRLTGRGEFATVRTLAALVERRLVAFRRGDDDADDSVAALLRRQAELSRLEGNPEPAPAEPAAPAAPAEPVASAEPAAEAPKRPEIVPDVVPQRPEPLLARRPDFAERRPASAIRTTTETEGSAAVAPAETVSPLIERDPSVNKSLLLRLIAGVRGL
ncbi:MAG TPA: DUF4388 domain-containing protein [Frankiaceae bacterium]|jgi:hypothetical protein|nr:DUF4388 domain-containing protein [Frankiaceae bacterium]